MDPRQRRRWMDERQGRGSSGRQVWSRVTFRVRLPIAPCSPPVRLAGSHAYVGDFFFLRRIQSSQIDLAPDEHHGVMYREGESRCAKVAVALYGVQLRATTEVSRFPTRQCGGLGRRLRESRTGDLGASGCLVGTWEARGTASEKLPSISPRGPI